MARKPPADLESLLAAAAPPKEMPAPPDQAPAPPGEEGQAPEPIPNQPPDPDDTSTLVPPPDGDIPRLGRSADDPAVIDAEADADAAIDGEIVPPPKVSYSGPVTYESRIRVLEAWQYPGTVPAPGKPGAAPDWIDRNWIGWADFDPLREFPAGPCLRVPLLNEVAICRPGDYVCRQEVLMLQGFPGDIRLEVWPKSQFEKLFLPVPAPIGATSTLPQSPSRDAHPSVNSYEA